MAFEEALFGMYDPRLKPRLLSSIMISHLPDDRQPPKSPTELSLAVSLIRRHHLLFEPATDESSGARTSSKTLDIYKVAVDAWIERLTVLISSTTTEKAWVGVCLLGVTSQECTRQRFLESYSLWFQKLLAHLKPTDPLFVRGAACASLTDLLTRLGALFEFAGVRRDGTGLSAKLAQPVLQLLGEEGSNSIWNDCIDLLCTILKYFPASLKQNSSQLEAVLVAKLMEVDIDASLSQKFARCLALLPKAHGDAATWNLLFRRILMAINSHLDGAFAGMEDANMAKDAVSALMPRGQEQSWFLGGVSVTASATTERGNKFWEMLVPRISVFLQCCCFLMVNAYPVQVPVPLSALLALVRRILCVDGSAYLSPSSLGVPISSAQQASLCCELPALHSCALDLLFAILSGVRSQLLPRAADIVRLLTEYFRHCGSPRLRIKLYNISKHLLISMGVGMASALAPALVDNSLSDLKGISSVCSLHSSNTPSNTSHPHAAAWAHGVPGWSHSANQRKRKDPGNMQMGIPPTMSALDVGVGNNEVTSLVAVQIAALEAMEALLTVGGSLRSDRWRADVDSVVANVAMIASAGPLSPGLVVEEDVFCRGGSRTFNSGSFQLAAYKAFLASLLSPCIHRPPFLSQGLGVFRKGRQEAVGTDVAEYCAHALLALEPLIHPRSLPFASTAGATPTSINPARVSGSETIVSQIQRPSLPLQPVLGSLSTAAMSHAYSTPLTTPTLKVSHAGMHLEVEGDQYVQEDIESWIIDYGGDQTVLNEPSNMISEGFDMGLQAVDNMPKSAPTGVANVSARQSLAQAEDGVMMSMVGDMLSGKTGESMKENRGGPSGPAEVPLYSTSMEQEKSTDPTDGNDLDRNAICTEEKHNTGLPSAAEIPPYSTSVEHDTGPGKLQSSLGAVEDARVTVSESTSQIEMTESHRPQTTSVVFPAVETHQVTESDSDTIPDIVVGESDTD